MARPARKIGLGVKETKVYDTCHMEKVDRQTGDLEFEIANQILIAETCFNVCKEIPIISGRGSDFLPYYYNLNFLKGAIVLHSLLSSTIPDELTIKSYLERYRFEKPGVELSDFEEKIHLISMALKGILPYSLRHKVFAHLDSNFKHYDFVSGYIEFESSLKKYILLTKYLKMVFYKFHHRSLSDGHQRILDQSRRIIKMVTSEF